MRDNTIRTVGAVVILLGIAIAAFSQIGSTGEPSAVSLVPTTEQSVANDETPPDSAAPGEPFVYRVGVLSGPSTNNFWAFYGEEPSVWNSYVLGPTKPSLFKLEEDGSLGLELAAELPQAIENDESWSVTVPLSDTYSWSDGEPVSAADLAFTFEVVRDLKLGGSWAESFPSSVKSIEAVDDETVKVVFSKQPTLEVWPHAIGLAPIMASHAWADAATDDTTLFEADASTDVAGGPLQVVETSEDLIVSIPNPGYPQSSAPDRVEYVVFADEAQAVEAVDQGVVDTILTPKGLTAEQVDGLSDNRNVVVQSSPSNGIRYLGFNLSRAPMNDRSFRRAVALLVDRESLAETFEISGEPAYSFISSSNESWYNAQSADKLRTRVGIGAPIATRLGDAVKMLTESGYVWVKTPSVSEDGKAVAGEGLTINGVEPAPLTVLTPGDEYDPARTAYASEIASSIELLGFEVIAVETDFDSVVDLAFTPNDDGDLQYDMYVLGWTLGSPALPGYYEQLFGAEGELNNTGYASADFQKQLAAYRSSTTAEEARSNAWEMEQTLAYDLPYLILYSTSITEIYRSDRVDFGNEFGLGGIQGQLGGFATVQPSS